MVMRVKKACVIDQQSHTLCICVGARVEFVWLSTGLTGSSPEFCKIINVLEGAKIMFGRHICLVLCLLYD